MKTRFASDRVGPDRTSLTVLWGALTIAALALAVLSAWPPAAAVRTVPQAPMVFTGSFDEGTPVYRLAPITVSASRDAVVPEAQADRREPPVAGAGTVRARSSS